MPRPARALAMAWRVTQGSELEFPLPLWQNGLSPLVETLIGMTVSIKLMITTHDSLLLVYSEPCRWLQCPHEDLQQRGLRSRRVRQGPCPRLYVGIKPPRSSILTPSFTNDRPCCAPRCSWWLPLCLRGQPRRQPAKLWQLLLWFPQYPSHLPSQWCW